VSPTDDTFLLAVCPKRAFIPFIYVFIHSHRHGRLLIFREAEEVVERYGDD